MARWLSLSRLCPTCDTGAPPGSRLQLPLRRVHADKESTGGAGAPTEERFPAVPAEPSGQPGGTMRLGTVLLSLRVAHKGAYLGLG